MNTERIEEIQKLTAYPDSISVQQALLKVWNECEQGKVVNKNDLLPDVRQQSELLKAFCSILLNAGDLTQLISDDEINSFLKAFNCA